MYNLATKLSLLILYLFILNSKFYFIFSQSYFVVYEILLFTDRRLLYRNYLFLLIFHPSVFILFTLAPDLFTTVILRRLVHILLLANIYYIFTFFDLDFISLQTFYWIFVQLLSRVKVKLSPIRNWLQLTICAAGLLWICWRRCLSIISMHRICIMARWVRGKTKWVGIKEQPESYQKIIFSKLNINI